MIPESPAPTTVKFECPACAATLTVPAAAAGLQGPCPKCWQEIISPDPSRGIPARLPGIQIMGDEPSAAPEEPAPPEPEDPGQTTSPQDPSSPANQKRPSKSILVASLLLSVSLFSVVGYFWGKASRNLSGESLAMESPAPGPRPTNPEPGSHASAAPLPADPPTPEEPALDPDLPGQLSARSTLIAFLDAPDWKARSAYVMFPEEVMPAMEAHAKEHGDGPIKTISIRQAAPGGVNAFFHVATPQMPDGVPVSVIGTDEGPMVDWESFVGFHDDHFRKFLEGPAEARAILDLLVIPRGESGLFFRYQLAVPMPDRVSDAYVRKDSIAYARLQAVFEGSGGYEKGTVDRLLRESGLPLVLALVKRETKDGQSFIEIEDFVAEGWGPPPP